MSTQGLIAQHLDTLKTACEQTQNTVTRLEQQIAQLTNQRDQAVQVFLQQRGAIQSTEELLKKTQDAEGMALVPTPTLDGAAVPVA